MSPVSLAAPQSPVTGGLAAALETYLGARLGRGVKVSGLSRLAGGASHETWAFTLDDPVDGELRLVLRKVAEDGPLDGDLNAEFDLLTALYADGLPVPRPYWCEVGDSPLERPFLVIERVDGSDVRKVLADPVRTPDRAALGANLVRLQARIHATPPRAEWGTGSPPAAEVEHWAAAAAATGRVGPLVDAAIGRLRADAPAPGRAGLVHGDFKANNLLFGRSGAVTVLDWELAHLGDPIEDLAWTMLWTTRFDLVGGLLPAAEYVRAYEAASGTAVDPDRLAFWHLFALVKLAAILLAGCAEPAGGRPVRPSMQLLGRAVVHLEHRIADALRGAPCGTAR